jgi:hypothetical protein
MKILIATLPRTGSKFLQMNLHSYLQAAGQVTKMIHPVYDEINGLGEFLNPINIKKHSERSADDRPMFKYTANLTNDSNILFIESLIDKDIEIENRLQILKKLTKPYVLKEIIFPTNNAQQLMPEVDLVYTIRRNIKERMLSVIVARFTGIYTKNALIPEAVASFNKDKIIVDKEMVNDILEFEKTYMRLVFPKTKTRELLYEDIIAIEDSQSFCSLTGLPFVNFRFIKDTVEFGNQKYEMISNLDDIENWIDEYLSNQE